MRAKAFPVEWEGELGKRISVALALLVLWLPGISSAVAADAPKPELVVVYWASKDCRWCTYWESPMSGMEKRFKESQEFKKIKYRVVKNERLADPYTLRDFPPDIVWVHERMRRGEEKRPHVRPAWAVYLDRKRIATFYGTKNWEEVHFREIKWLVSEHLGQ